MTGKILRGRTLSFLSEPVLGSESDSYVYEEDGAVHVDDGIIKATGSYADVKLNALDNIEVVDHRPYILIAGFIDPHLHFPQVQIIGSYAPDLLTWLNTYTFVEEQKFGSTEHGARIASVFFDELIKHGTTTAAAYCSVHKQSAEVFFAESHRRNMLMIGGKVMMDRNAPVGLLDTPQSGYDDTKALIETWHGTGRQHYAISPRFAITSTPAQMEMSGALAQEHPECFVQTHLSENANEIALACELFPQCKDYTDIYAQYGLLGPKSLFGHSIHLSDREIAAMSESGSVAVFCPTSNLFLGSGLFNFEKLRNGKHPVRIGVATDIGGGTSYSMLKTLDEAFKVMQLQGQRLTPVYSFYQTTLGNACALGLEDRIGNLSPGSDADILVLDANATSAMSLRMETVSTLEEELFVMQTLGDDRTVAEVYIAGEASKPGA